MRKHDPFTLALESLRARAEQGSFTLALPDGIAADLRAFVEAVEADKTFDPKALKLTPPDAGQLVARLKAVYNL